jgi:hypothetical protein
MKQRLCRFSSSGWFLLAGAALVLLGVALGPSRAHAQLLPIVNAGFEDPVQSNNNFTSGGINGWTNSGISGVWRPVSAGFFSVPVPEGAQVGYINDVSVAQQLASPLSIGSYTLAAQVGRRNDGFQGTIQIELWAGGTVASGNVTGGTLLTFVSLAPADQTLGGFELLTAPTFAANGSTPQLGQQLSVRIVKLNGSQVDFDAVTVNFVGSGVAAPESGTLSLLLGAGAMGLVGVTARRRRR